MTKKQITILVIALIVIAAGVVWMTFTRQSEPVNPPVTVNKTKEYKIDMSSDIDTSSWPIFTSKKLGFSIKYHPDGRWRSNDPYIEDPPEVPSPSFGFPDPYAGFFDIDSFLPAVSFEQWVNAHERSPFVIMSEKIILSNKPALVELEERIKGNRNYRIYLYSAERGGMLVMRVKSEYTDAQYPEREKNIGIYKTMLQTINFQPKVDLDVSKWGDRKIEALGVTFKLPNYFGDGGGPFNYITSEFQFSINQRRRDENMFFSPPQRFRKQLEKTTKTNLHKVTGQLTTECISYDGNAMVRLYAIPIDDSLVEVRLAYFGAEWNDYARHGDVGYPSIDEFFSVCEKTFESIQVKEGDLIIIDQVVVLDKIFDSFKFESTK